jgi:hypothetical protein
MEKQELIEKAIAFKQDTNNKDFKSIPHLMASFASEIAKEEAVKFAEWVYRLEPNQRCTIHPPAGSGGSYGIYLLTPEQLYERYLRGNEEKP